MRGLRNQIDELVTGASASEMRSMTIGLAHSLSRYKLKFSPDKVDTMIVQALHVPMPNLTVCFVMCHPLNPHQRSPSRLPHPEIISQFSLTHEQAIGLLDDLDKELNTYAMRLKEW